MARIVAWQDQSEAVNWMKMVDSMLSHRTDLTIQQVMEHADEFTLGTRDRRPALMAPGRN